MIALSWSGGKDAALALESLRAQGKPPELLLCTVDEKSGRVTHHGTPRELLRAQAEALGLPLLEIEVPSAGDAEAYAERMRIAFSQAPLSEVESVAFGDLFLEELRRFREQRLNAVGVEATFPLWGRETGQLAQELIASDYEALVVSVDPTQLSPALLGRRLDAALLAELPDGVDPCGEQGEFHTFVRDCPEFREPVAVRVGAQLEQDGFPFLELLLG